MLIGYGERQEGFRYLCQKHTIARTFWQYWLYYLTSVCGANLRQKQEVGQQRQAIPHTQFVPVFILLQQGFAQVNVGTPVFLLYCIV